MNPAIYDVLLLLQVVLLREWFSREQQLLARNLVCGAKD
jgi:hypothetical protein